MSVTSLGEPIARGTVADIYAWGEDHTLKLFLDWVPTHGAEWEAQAARAVHAAGLPAPAVGEIIEVDDRLGLIYERVEGVSVAEDLLATPHAEPETILRLAHHPGCMRTYTLTATCRGCLASGNCWKASSPG